MIEYRDDSPPPFYTSMNIHDKVLHNFLMDLGASHSLMPKIVMEELGLEITKAYHDLYYFDSKRVQCLGVIKDLVMTLFQLPMKSVVMDIVVADVPPKFGMILSRYWIKRLGGTLQMDLTYSTILVFGGDHRRLYIEAQLAYIITDESNPTNHLIFSLDIKLGANLLQFTDAPEPALNLKKESMVFHEVSFSTTSVWKMFFDGASSKDFVVSGVVFVSLAREAISLSYKLEFEDTNNVEEYESLVLGLRVAKDMGIKEISVFGDAKLIINQIRNMYQAKHPRIITYRNEVWDLIDSFFFAINISFISRETNTVVDSLATLTNNFRIPPPPKLRYDVEVKYRPSIPNNVKHWKFFEDDLEIEIFLETVEEFSTLHIDQDQDSANSPHANELLSKIVDHHIVQLPNNHIPTGLVHLEILFDRNDVEIKGKISNDDVDVAECNIGIEKDPKFVKLSSILSREKRSKYTELLK
jgi:ribonuclease HI